MATTPSKPKPPDPNPPPADPALLYQDAGILWIQGDHLIRLDSTAWVPIAPADIPAASAAVTGAFAPQIADGTLAVYIPPALDPNILDYKPPAPPPVCMPVPVCKPA
jgi:hypothetical protein